jgi:hypothetical protein
VLAVLEACGILLLSALGDDQFQVGADLATVGFLASVVLFPVVGALIVQRRPETRVAWLMMAIGLGFGLALLAFGYGATGLASRTPRPGAVETLMLAQLLFVPVPSTGITLLMLLFPSDRFLSRRWRLVAVAGVVGAITYALGTLILPGPIDRESFPAVENPFGLSGLGDLAELLIRAGNTTVVASIALGATSLVVRYRRADAVEAAQIRWIALVAGLAAIALPIAALQLDVGSDLAFGIGLVVLACLPIAIGFAITRYRLYEIDRLINRALVYGALTAILAGVFTAGIGLAQRLFIAVTRETSDAAIVITTLVVATLYAPLRKRLEAIVDRAFKYDDRLFGAYRDEVKRILSIVEPSRAAERLATEAVRELGARGVAIVDAEDRPTATAGEWPLPAVIRLPIRGAAPSMTALLAGPRADGQPHDPRSVAELEEVVGLVAAAVHLSDDRS